MYYKRTQGYWGGRMPEVRAQFLQGDGNTLVITFNDMGGSFRNQRFWGESVLRKIGVPAYGITAVGPTRFPYAETVAALREVIVASRNYNTIVLYGYSMGAYAAVKYSSLFNNPVVLAFSPQVSINPNDCGDNDSRYCHYFDACLNKSMKIESADVGGRVLLFFDPSTHTEKFHAESIPGPTIAIPMYGCGHGTVHAITSTKLLQNLLKNAISGDYALIRKEMRLLKRRLTDYHRAMFFALDRLSHNSKGAWFADLVGAAGSRDMEISTLRGEFYKRVGRTQDAATAYRLAYAADPQPRFLEWARAAEEMGFEQAGGS